MKHLFILDYEHLDDGGFLKEFAKKLGSLQPAPCIFIHADSAYTERIIQSGVLSNEARIRAIKELNHRLTALFADEGIAVSAFNGYQRGIVKSENNSNELIIDTGYLKKLGGRTHLLISNLIENSDGGVSVTPLHRLAAAIKNQLKLDKIYAFSKTLNSSIIKSEQPDEKIIPGELEPISDIVVILDESGFRSDRVFL